MKSLITAAAAAFLLSGCTQRGLEKLGTLNAVAEKEVDATVAFMEERRCSLPVDVLRRQAELRGEAWLRGYVLSCPDTFGALLNMTIMGELDRAGILDRLVAPER